MTDATKALGVADIQKIMACIPHRYPFLLVDKVVEIDGDASGVGIKNVTFNEPQFTTWNDRFGRLKPVTRSAMSGRFNCSRMSSRTYGVAVAVNAQTCMDCSSGVKSHSRW